MNEREISEIALVCQVAGCDLAATHWVGNFRGERMPTCFAHMSLVADSLVRPLVTELS